MKKSWLTCMDCGFVADLLAERVFRCPECGGLYDVTHHYPNLVPGGGKGSYYELCAERLGRMHNFDLATECHSGVWAFRELVMPQFDSRNIISLGERINIVFAGRNLMQWLDGCIGSLFIALEGLSPTGSFKDFGGTVLATVAKAAGAKMLVCASTGDTSAMAAAYAARAGLKCAVLLPKGKVSSVQLVQPLAYGARVIMVPGDFDDCMRIMQELIDQHGAYPANSINPARIEGHQATVFNAWRYFGALPDWIVAPVGNGSNISSIGKGQRALRDLGLVEKMSRLLGCQAQLAAPLTRSWQVAGVRKGRVSAADWLSVYEPVKAQNTLASAQQIGNPVSHKKVVREIVASEGAMEMASESEITEAIRVCGSDGHFVCPQTAVALVGLRRAITKGVVGKKDRVLLVSTALGIKFPAVLEGGAESLTREMHTLNPAEAAELISS